MSHVRSLMSRPLTGPYRPTADAVHWWFHCINREIFRGVLPTDVRFRLNDESDSWAYYVAPDLIAYERRYETKQQFVAVLGHEMVHHWQAHHCRGNHCHGPTFLRWQPIFRRHGVILVPHGDVHVPESSLVH